MSNVAFDAISLSLAVLSHLVPQCRTEAEACRTNEYYHSAQTQERIDRIVPVWQIGRED
jgi:hypothetical protein